MVNRGDSKTEILSIINDRQQATYSELSEMAFRMGIGEKELQQNLKELEDSGRVASRTSGGMLTFYGLQQGPDLRKVLIVEDDKNINKLMALSIGTGFEIRQVYDGREAIKSMREDKPDLVVLDLMLPSVDGLDICHTAKTDPKLRDTIIIIVSAMDAATNRFRGIKYGADYYIKKPFDPKDLRSLVTIFLKKNGKRFDPLVDLPNEDRISKEMEAALSRGDNYEIGRLRLDGLAGFIGKYGVKSALAVLRLLSQLLQDHVKEVGSGAFVGFLNSEEFVLAGEKAAVDEIVRNVSEEFDRVKGFILQSEGYKPIELGIDEMYDVEKPKLEVSYKALSKDSLMKRREQILAKHGTLPGTYTYEELREMLGSESIDVIITRDSNGLKLSVGKNADMERHT